MGEVSLSDWFPGWGCGTVAVVVMKIWFRVVGFGMRLGNSVLESFGL